MRGAFRTAAVVASSAVLVSLPVGNAFADSTPAPIVTPPFTPPAPEPIKPKVERQSVGEQQLAGGYVADVYKHVASHPKGQVRGYEAEIRIAMSGPLVTLKAFGKSATGTHGGYLFTLSADGKVTAVKKAPSGGGKGDGGKGDADKEHGGKGGSEKGKGGDHAGGGADKNTPGDGSGGGHTKPVVPKGAVKAGAEDVDSRDTGLAAGGAAGIALIGAAGLGFALVRRGRSAC
ncbi:hypothetical protein [Streptomyces melanogenes]|uniref:hypothetical protein n=1 Tax=Streptomyces melanogenes TaxID=67326 RepID=UPI00378F5EF7